MAHNERRSSWLHAVQLNPFCSLQFVLESVASRKSLKIDQAYVILVQVPWEGFGGLWDIKKIMMWNAMRWVLDESGAPGPEISVDPAHLDFGSVEDGEKGEMSFEVKNVGVETLEISQLCTIYWDDETIYPEGSSAFSVTENLIYYGDPKLSIEPGESETVKVEFQPIWAKVNTG